MTAGNYKASRSRPRPCYRPELKCQRARRASKMNGEKRFCHAEIAPAFSARDFREYSTSAGNYRGSPIIQPNRSRRRI